jgi:hypothetical protein
MVMCQWVQNRIPAYLSGELGARQARWLVWHVKQCHVCQKAMKILKSMSGIVAKALTTDVQVPETLDARVMAAIDGLPLSHAPPPRRFRFRFWWRR